MPKKFNRSLQRDDLETEYTYLRTYNLDLLNRKNYETSHVLLSFNIRIR